VDGMSAAQALSGNRVFKEESNPPERKAGWGPSKPELRFSSVDSKNLMSSYSGTEWHVKTGRMGAPKTITRD
jgi:hypothetical protein